MNPETLGFFIYGLIGVVIAAVSCFVYWKVFEDGYYSEMEGEHMFGGIVTGVLWPFGIFFLLFFSLILAGKRLMKKSEERRRAKS